MTASAPDGTATPTCAGHQVHEAFASEPPQHFADRDRPHTTFGLWHCHQVRASQDGGDSGQGLTTSQEVDHSRQLLHEAEGCARRPRLTQVLDTETTWAWCRVGRERAQSPGDLIRSNLQRQRELADSDGWGSLSGMQGTQSSSSGRAVLAETLRYQRVARFALEALPCKSDGQLAALLCSGSTSASAAWRLVTPSIYWIYKPV